MKKNTFLLIVQAMLALITSASLMPQSFADGFVYWCLTFCFWFLMLAPFWDHKYERTDRMTDEAIKEKWGK